MTAIRQQAEQKGLGLDVRLVSAASPGNAAVEPSAAKAVQALVQERNWPFCE